MFHISVSAEKTIRMLFAVEQTCLTFLECGNDEVRILIYFRVTSLVMMFKRNCGSEVFLKIVAHSDALFLLISQQMTFKSVTFWLYPNEILTSFFKM
jgi:hypothetical protein